MTSTGSFSQSSLASNFDYEAFDSFVRNPQGSDLMAFLGISEAPQLRSMFICDSGALQSELIPLFHDAIRTRLDRFPMEITMAVASEHLKMLNPTCAGVPVPGSLPRHRPPMSVRVPSAPSQSPPIPSERILMDPKSLAGVPAPVLVSTKVNVRYSAEGQALIDNMDQESRRQYEQRLSELKIHLERNPNLLLGEGNAFMKTNLENKAEADINDNVHTSVDPKTLSLKAIIEPEVDAELKSPVMTFLESVDDQSSGTMITARSHESDPSPQMLALAALTNLKDDASSLGSLETLPSEVRSLPLEERQTTFMPIPPEQFPLTWRRKRRAPQTSRGWCSLV